MPDLVEQIPKLFDDSALIAGDPRLEIPELLGQEVGQFLSAPRFVHIFTEVDESGVLESARTPYTHHSPDYVDPDGVFDGDFINWKPATIEQPELEGYLVGFPRIINPFDRPNDYVHIWQNYSDVFGGSYAVPLQSLAAFFIHSDLCTRLEIEREEEAMGADLELGTMTQHDQPPVAVYAKSNLHPGTVFMAPRQDLQSLLITSPTS